MDYLIVYDKFETAFSNMGLAVLENASSVKIKEVINGEFLLSFILPRNDPKWQYIQPENFVKVYDCSQKKDQLFRVRGFDEQRDSTGKLTSNVQCEHVYYDAQDCKFFPTVELIGQTPAQILAYAFSGTRFTIGTVEITTPTDIVLDKVYPKQIVDKLIENVDGELIKDNWTVNLVTKRGSNAGVQFRFGKNIASIKKSTDGSIVTRLYPYGKDGLPIPGELGYIDSPLIGNYDRAKIGYIDYKDVEDPAELLTTAQAEWSTVDKDGIDKPRVTYSGEVLELKKLKEYGDFEAYGLGDTVKVIDDGIDTNTLQRIMEYEQYPYEAKRSTVSMSNTKPSVYKKNRYQNKIGSTFAATHYVNEIKDSSNKIDPGWFQNIKTKLKTLFNGQIHRAVVHTQGDIWVDNPDNPTMAMAIIAGGFAIANSKDANNNWEWKVFGTATDGFVADLITAGTLLLNDNLSISNVTGNMKITGSEITLTRTDGKVRITLNLTDGMKIQKNTGTVETPVWVDVNYQDVDGNAIFTGNIIGSKFYGTDIDSAFIEIGTGGTSNFGDLKLFRGGGTHPIFSIYDGASIVDLKAGDGTVSPSTFLSSSGANTYPIGNYNCSGASFINLRNGSDDYATISDINGAIANHILIYHSTP